jgi:hypothetical protein
VAPKHEVIGADTLSLVDVFKFMLLDEDRHETK